MLEKKNSNTSKNQSLKLLGIGFALMVLFSSINLFGLYPNSYSYEETSEQFIVHEGVISATYTVEQREVDELSKAVMISHINSLNNNVLLTTFILFFLPIYIFVIIKRGVRFNLENKLDAMHVINICILLIFLIYNIRVYYFYIGQIQSFIERIFL